MTVRRPGPSAERARVARAVAATTALIATLVAAGGLLAGQGVAAPSAPSPSLRTADSVLLPAIALDTTRHAVRRQVRPVHARRSPARLTVSPTTMEPGDDLRVHGRIAPGPRRVVVQVREVGRSWSRVSSVRTDRTGRFRVTLGTAATESTTLEVRAVGPRARIRGKVRPRVVTRAVRVRFEIPPDAEWAAMEDEVLDLTNTERAEVGCPPLVAEDRLRTAARGHSLDMAEQDYFSHTSLDGRTMRDRVEDAGYTGWTRIAENIAAGQDTPESVVAAWMNSEGHRRNILNCAYTELGVGVAESPGSAYGIYWTQNFGVRG